MVRPVQPLARDNGQETGRDFLRDVRQKVSGQKGPGPGENLLLSGMPFRFLQATGAQAAKLLLRALWNRLHCPHRTHRPHPEVLRASPVEEKPDAPNRETTGVIVKLAA
jgi:hypothetical protein